MKTRTRSKLAAVGLAISMIAGPAAVAVPAASAQAVPYKIPNGTWGGLCGKGAYTYHVRFERHGVSLVERRHYTEWRNKRENNQWRCRVKASYDYFLTVA